MAGRPTRVALWDAINQYTQSCGGRVDSISVRRMNAVISVERAVDSEVETLCARVAELERERDEAKADRDALRGRIVTRLHEVADVIAGYTGSDPAAKEVAVYAAMRIRSAADEFLPDGALPPDAAKKVTCRQCVHQSEGVCREVGEWLSDPDAPFSRGACPNFTDRYPVEKDDTHER